jgi:hypothetical protein
MSREKLPASHTSRPNANGLIAHPNSAVGGGGPGVARTRGSIGLGGDTSDFIYQAPALRHAVPLFELFTTKKKRLSTGKKPSKKASAKKDIELSFVGDWPSEWESMTPKSSSLPATLRSARPISTNYPSYLVRKSEDLRRQSHTPSTRTAAAGESSIGHMALMRGTPRKIRILLDIRHFAK